MYRSEKLDYGEQSKIFYDKIYEVVYDERNIWRLEKIKKVRDYK